MSISYEFLSSTPTQTGNQTLNDGNNSENEYARINRLLSGMATEMASSMEEIQSINNMMRLISFNSKIEAAKAGEAGKAFAIVSGEMKTLSEKTSEVARKLNQETHNTIGELQSISDDLATQVRGTRLSDLALTNIDLIDRNLYERSCDVRWWATDSSLVDALGSCDEEACTYACERLGVILNAYTVYYDLVLCDTKGEIVANGRPGTYRSIGRHVGNADWFLQALNSRSGDDYGFQSVHPSELVRNERVLVYSSSVREGGRADGKVLGVLGILFNYDSLAQEIMLNTPIDSDLLSSTRVCITDRQGLVLADSHNKILQETLDFPGMMRLYGESKGFSIEQINGNRYCIAHAEAPGYETYSTGWHSLILQQI